ncbi:membrane protein [Azorhizobium doebereinerae]|uniref:membrane protein n=1 Tax=Azorhizobium doebereinerae TaxID=281091 RepID=UPI0003FDC432|nr:membrane protein [Azorhizobium doebereinerae]
MDDVAFARALHVIAVVHWIGGLSFVTFVLLPLARALTGVQGAALVELVERRFVAQVRLSVPLAGATGFWMVYRMNLWSRFHEPAYWWMGTMVALWVVFMLLLFVMEPLLHRIVERRARRQPQVTLLRMSRLHEALLAGAAITILGAVAGAHGLFFP